VSALTGEGLPELRSAIVHALSAAPMTAAIAPITKLALLAESVRPLEVERVAGGFVVRGSRVEKLVERTDLDSESALERFQSSLDRLGVNAAVEAAGARPGDSVRIAGVEFEYQP